MDKEEYQKFSDNFDQKQDEKRQNDLARLKVNGLSTDEIFEREAKKAKQYLEEQIENEEKYTYTIDELIKKQFPPQQWLVEGLIPAEGFIALTGQPGSYKSFLTEVLAVSLAEQKPFLGHFQVSKSPVLIIDKENSPFLLKERFRLLGLEKPENAPIYFLEDPDKFKLSDEEQVQKVINFIEVYGINLVIIDSFAHIHQGDENDSSAVVVTFETLKRFNCAVLFIHHHRKTIKFFTGSPLETIRGSSDIGAELESHLAIDIIPNGLRLSQSKNRRGQLMKPFLITQNVTQDKISFDYAGEVQEEESKIEETIQYITEILTPIKELSRRELIEVLSGKSTRISIDRALKQMEENHLIKSFFTGKFKYVSLLNNVTQLSNVEISSIEQSYLDEID